MIKSDINGYYLYNAHGDVIQLTDQQGTVTTSYLYDAFGIEQGTQPNDPNPFRYCGEYLDKESGNVYLRARYYDPETGRFINEDPIRDGLNWYVYCSNDPVNYIDPSGYRQAGDENLPDDVQDIIDEATTEYLDAQKAGDADGMAAAHQKAEDARASVGAYSSGNCTVTPYNDFSSWPAGLNDLGINVNINIDININLSGSEFSQLSSSSGGTSLGVNQFGNNDTGIREVATGVALYGIDGTIQEGAKLFGKTVSSQLGTVYAGITTASDINATLSNANYTTNQKITKVAIQLVGGAVDVTGGAAIAEVAVLSAPETLGGSLIIGAAGIVVLNTSINKTQNWLYCKLDLK